MSYVLVFVFGIGFLIVRFDAQVAFCRVDETVHGAEEGTHPRREIRR